MPKNSSVLIFYYVVHKIYFFCKNKMRKIWLLYFSSSLTWCFGHINFFSQTQEKKIFSLVYHVTASSLHQPHGDVLISYINIFFIILTDQHASGSRMGWSWLRRAIRLTAKRGHSLSRMPVQMTMDCTTVVPRMQQAMSAAAATSASTL